MLPNRHVAQKLEKWQPLEKKAKATLSSAFEKKVSSTASLSSLWKKGIGREHAASLWKKGMDLEHLLFEMKKGAAAGKGLGREPLNIVIANPTINNNIFWGIVVLKIK